MIVLWKVPCKVVISVGTIYGVLTKGLTSKLPSEAGAVICPHLTGEGPGAQRG